MKRYLAAAIAVLIFAAPAAGATTVSERDTHIQKYLNRHLISEEPWAKPKQVRVTDGFAHRPSILKAAWVQAVVEVGYVKPPPPPPEPVVASSSTPTTGTTSGVGAGVGYHGDIADLICSYDWECSIALGVSSCESGMSPTADNPSSSAYGLFQRLGETSSDPAVQVANAYAMWKARYWQPWGWPDGEWGCYW